VVGHGSHRVQSSWVDDGRGWHCAAQMLRLSLCDQGGDELVLGDRGLGQDGHLFMPSWYKHILRHHNSIGTINVTWTSTGLIDRSGHLGLALIDSLWHTAFHGWSRICPLRLGKSVLLLGSIALHNMRPGHCRGANMLRLEPIVLHDKPWVQPCSAWPSLGDHLGHVHVRVHSVHVLGGALRVVEALVCGSHEGRVMDGHGPVLVLDDGCRALGSLGCHGGGGGAGGRPCGHLTQLALLVLFR